MLEIDGLHAGYGKVEILAEVGLTIAAGTCVTLIGANGAGKSTLVGCISGIVSRFAGRILFEGEDITRLSAPEIVDRGIVQVPEGRQLFGALSVEENLRLGHHRLRSRGRDTRGYRARLDEIYAMFPRLKERARQKAATLSGGEQQMVALGRALMAEPRLLLLDEPSLGLAPLVVEQIFDTLKSLREGGMTMLLVEQRADDALALADEAYVLSVGRIVASGPAARLREDPRIQEAYLGALAAD